MQKAIAVIIIDCMFARVISVLAFAAALSAASCSSTDTTLVTDGGLDGSDDASTGGDDSSAACSSCPNGASCVNGSCQCPGAESVCGNDCVDLTSDRNNCGNCGVSCTGSCSLSGCVK